MDPNSNNSAEDDDPVVASYDVFLQPGLANGRRLFVLQNPNRSHNQEQHAPPTEFRLKRNTGLVEVDVPIDLNRAYDKKKGQEWGSALQRSTAAKSGGCHGLAGGFSLGAPPARSRRGEEKEDGMLDWNEAVRTDKVLRTTVHGGMAPEKSECNYLVAAFQGKNVTLTPVSSIISLRPQFHHIDAFAEQERRREAAAAQSGATGPAGQAGGRAIHMTIKTDHNDVTTETMADRLKAVQADKWTRCAYIDENQPDAWEHYDELLVKATDDDASKNNGEGVDKKGKSINCPAAADGADLVEKVSHLRTKTTGEVDLLYAVSGKERPVHVPEAGMGDVMVVKGNK